MRLIIGLMILVGCAASGVKAQIKPQHFPADVKWVLHLDLKALNASCMGDFIRRSMDEQALRGLTSLKAMSGIDMTNDVDSLVVCGKGAAEAGGVMYAYGRFNMQKLTAVASGAKDYQNKVFGERSLLSWSDKGKRNNLCFIDPTLVVMSQEEGLVQEAVNLIDGKAKGMEAGRSFAKMLTHKKGRFLAVQANNLAALAGANPQLQLFKQAEALLLEVGQMGGGANGLDCALVLKAANAQMAQQMNQAAMGLQALFQLQAAQNPDAAELAQNTQVGMQDDYVTVNLKLPEALLQKQIQGRIDQQKRARAARGPAGDAAPKKADRPAF